MNKNINQPSIQLFHTKAPDNIIYIFKPVMLLYGILLKAIITQMQDIFFHYQFCRQESQIRD